MAYEIIGNVFKVGTTENKPTKNGGSFPIRSITLIQRRFDQNTGEEFEPNYPTLDFIKNGCAELDKFKEGDRVRIRFDVSGVKYKDKNTGEERFFNSLRGFRIEPYVAQQQQVQPQYAPQPQGYVPQQQYPPQQGYVPQGYQQGQAPFAPPSIDPATGLPF